MGNWYFGREHALFAACPPTPRWAASTRSRAPIERAAGRRQRRRGLIAYSRDHDRNVGAGTFTTRLGKGKVLYHRTPEFHPVLQQRFLANALRWLTA
jgi:beta-galactosidase